MNSHAKIQQVWSKEALSSCAMIFSHFLTRNNGPSAVLSISRIHSAQFSPSLIPLLTLFTIRSGMYEKTSICDSTPRKWNGDLSRKGYRVSERDISHGLINETFVSSSRSSHEFDSESKTKRILSFGLRVYFSTIIMIPVSQPPKLAFLLLAFGSKILAEKVAHHSKQF